MVNMVNIVPALYVCLTRCLILLDFVIYTIRNAVDVLLLTLFEQFTECRNNR